MAQQVKLLVTKPDDLRLISSTYMMESKVPVPQSSCLSLTQKPWHKYTHTDSYTHTVNKTFLIS